MPFVFQGMNAKFLHVTIHWFLMACNNFFYINIFLWYRVLRIAFDVHYITRKFSDFCNVDSIHDLVLNASMQNATFCMFISVVICLIVLPRYANNFEMQQTTLIFPCKILRVKKEDFNFEAFIILIKFNKSIFNKTKQVLLKSPFKVKSVGMSRQN